MKIQLSFTFAFNNKMSQLSTKVARRSLVYTELGYEADKIINIHRKFLDFKNLYISSVTCLLESNNK